MNNNFKVGEKVVALTDSHSNASQDRVAGNIYTITAIRYCPNCGAQAININNKSNKDHHPMSRCSCKTDMPANNRGWTHSYHFTRPLTNKYKLEVSIPELITIEKLQLQ